MQGLALQGILYASPWLAVQRSLESRPHCESVGISRMKGGKRMDYALKIQFKSRNLRSTIQCFPGIWMPEFAYRRLSRWKSPVDETRCRSCESGGRGSLRKRASNTPFVDSFLPDSRRDALGTYAANFRNSQNCCSRAASKVFTPPEIHRSEYEHYDASDRRDGLCFHPIRRRRLKVWSDLTLVTPATLIIWNSHEAALSGRLHFAWISEDKADLGRKKPRSIAAFENVQSHAERQLRAGKHWRIGARPI